VYLKRDSTSTWLSRLLDWLGGGWGPQTATESEARRLEWLERDGLPAPRCLAVGQDAFGQGFLLVEAIEGATPLGVCLHDPRRRRPLARSLGRLLARLHAAGYCHHDLYAKHVICVGDECHIIDWQRCLRGDAPLGQWSRQRDLATLDATLPDELASPRDRLALLRAYLGGRRGLRRFAAEVRVMSGKLLTRRHIREKRCPAPPDQSWTCLDGEALCVTPALDADAEWLALDRLPLPRGAVSCRRWVELPGGRRCLLVRRRQPRSGPSDEMRRANLLWRLQRHGVAGPLVLAAGQRGDDSFLLIEPPADAVSLTAWLRTRSRRGVVLRRLAEMVHHMHDGCCYLGERGVGMIAVRGDEPVLLDADGVTPARKPDEGRRAEDVRLLRERVAPHVGAEGWRMVEQVLGPPASGPWHRWRQGEWQAWCRPDWAELAGEGWLERIMALAVTDRFHEKQGRSTGRVVLDGPGGRRLVVYLKRHYQLPWLDRLRALFWPGGWSPAMQERRNLEWAREQGVPVPAVVAAGEHVGPGLSLQSFLAVEELEGMIPLHEAVPLAGKRMAPDEFRRWKRGLVAEMARLSRLLHDRRHFHKDLYLCHFYVREDDTAQAVPDWRGRVSMIDLHRLGHHPWTWRWYQLKDLAQLLYSSEVPGVTARDRVAFWRAYQGDDLKSSRWLRWWVLLRWRRYRQHNLKRKARAGEPGAKCPQTPGEPGAKRPQTPDGGEGVGA
jgi:heptose I phosphotransferase